MPVKNITTESKNTTNSYSIKLDSKEKKRLKEVIAMVEKVTAEMHKDIPVTDSISIRVSDVSINELLVPAKKKATPEDLSWCLWPGEMVSKGKKDDLTKMLIATWNMLVGNHDFEDDMPFDLVFNAPGGMAKKEIERRAKLINDAICAQNEFFQEIESSRGFDGLIKKIHELYKIEYYNLLEGLSKGNEVLVW